MEGIKKIRSKEIFIIIAVYSLASQKELFKIQASTWFIDKNGMKDTTYRHACLLN